MNDLPAPPARLLDGAALFLDFDGTLVELAETPDAIDIPATLGPLLGSLAKALSGRLAVVSGRALADLDRRLPWPAIGVSGSHGLEVRLADGRELPLARPAEMEEVVRRAEAFAGSAGLLVETKPASVAIHYRSAPQAAAAVDAFMTRLAADFGFQVQRGAMVVELRAPGANKGDAIRTFMATAPFHGATPIFIGDDLTDEHAFAAAEALGGAGVLVGPMRETVARYRLPGAAAVGAWLEQAV